MKKLSSYIISVYLLLTTIPLILFGAVSLGKDLMHQHQLQTKKYNRVIEQQSLYSQKALAQFDLQKAELIVTQISELQYVTSVKLDSILYGMTLAEVVNADSESSALLTQNYPIYQKDKQVGVLSVTKDNHARVNHLITSMLPRFSLLLLLLAAIALLFGKTVWASLRRPFSELQSFALQITNGDYKTPPKTTSKFFEVTQIFKALEIMRLKLKSTINELKQSEERHTRTYNLTQVCLFVISIEKNWVIRANSMFYQIFGQIPEERKKGSYERAYP